MTDRELLELAAKAAGMEGWEYAHRNDVTWGFERRNANGTTTFWNPLTDDGDALRLAAKLGLSISFEVDCVDVNRWAVRYYVDFDRDRCAAARRAILDAAAEAGRAMNGTAGAKQQDQQGSAD